MWAWLFCALYRPPNAPSSDLVNDVLQPAVRVWRPFESPEGLAKHTHGALMFVFDDTLAACCSYKSSVQLPQLQKCCTCLVFLGTHAACSTQNEFKLKQTSPCCHPCSTGLTLRDTPWHLQQKSSSGMMQQRGPSSPRSLQPSSSWAWTL